jgi:hypothetical protein
MHACLFTSLEIKLMVPDVSLFCMQKDETSNVAGNDRGPPF